MLVPSDAGALTSVVSQTPGGRVFCLAAGSYDMRDVIKPRDGDRFLGAGSRATGTILRGATTFTGWASNNGLFLHAGGVVALPRGGTCAAGSACQYPDWVYVDGVALTRAVTAGDGTSYGILVRGTHRPGDQAQSGPGSQGLAIDNRVEGNDITLPSGSSGWNGVLHGSGAQTSRNSFTANAYHVPDCAARRWKWWTGTAMTRVPFAGDAPSWQAFAQDSMPAGICSA
jgi:hypothetical protein